MSCNISICKANKYMNNYDKIKESSFLIYDDANMDLQCVKSYL